MLYEIGTTEYRELDFQTQRELSDGSLHKGQGQLKNQGTENEGIAMQGRYAWVEPDGVNYIITYVTDEGGFQPTIQKGPRGEIASAVVASLLGTL
ncbi:Flexible cuticle protein 12 [Papilio xuthus]|uniref:Flexible cuticle protein 12 n=1 Tax=Papilio xuthus TaxID=66420 RepID=A0A194PX35_PAPXU|nr:Flexible cuticle protein 12 [Papilio xuthus]